MLYGFLFYFFLFFIRPPPRFPDDNFLTAKADRCRIFAGHGSWSKEEVYRFPTQRDPQGGGGGGRGAPLKSQKFQDPRNI